jgi:hypothetical protein
VLAICLTVEVLVGLLLSRQQGFWSPDSAVRFVQVRSLLQTHYHDVAVAYPAASLDPGGAHFPIGAWFHFGRGGRFYLSYLPYFSMVTAPFYHLFGFPGLFLIPAAAGCGAVWVTHHVLRAHAPDLAWAGALALGIGTPLIVYSVVFWDHSLAVMLGAATLAVLGAEVDRSTPLRLWRLALSGGLLGMGLWIRSEIYLLAVASALAWLYASPRAARVKGLGALIGGIAIPAAVLWGVNTHLFGSPLGWKGQDLVTSRVSSTVHAVTGHTLASWVGEKLGNAYYQLASPDFYAFNTNAVAAGIAMSLGLGVCGVLLRVGLARRSRGVLAVGMLTAIAVGAAIVSGRTTISGLLPAFPLVVLVMLPGARSRWERFLWATILLFCAAVIVTGTHGGLQWGPRYLLPVLPALVWLGAAAMSRARAAVPTVWPTLRLAAAALAAAGVLIQVSGVDQVLQATMRNARINRWLSETPAPIVITPLEWLTLGAGPVYFEKELMLVRTPEDFKEMVVHLSDRHVARWTYIPSSGLTFTPMAVKGWTTGRPWQFRPADDRFRDGLRFVTYTGSPPPP